MLPHVRDTHPSAAAAQLAMLRAAGPTRRAALAIALSEDVIASSRRALAALHPELDERGMKELWARIHYGAAAERLLGAPR